MTRTDISTEIAAAAAEQSGEGHVLVIRGEEFTLPGGSLPWAASIEIARFAKEQGSPIQAVQAGSIVALADSMVVVFGEEQYQRLLRLGLSVAEFMVVVNAVTELYTGAEVGEAPGSSGGSPNTGGLPKPTSNGSTGSTSEEPVSESQG